MVVVRSDPRTVDKLVWMVICQAAQGIGTKAVSQLRRHRTAGECVVDVHGLSCHRDPARDTLAVTVRAKSRSERSIRRQRHALHDEPLPLTDALHLDPGYMAFLEEAAVIIMRGFAGSYRRSSASLDQDIRSGRTSLAPVNPMERRLEALHAIQRGDDRRYFSFNAEVLWPRQFTRCAPGRRNQDQNSKAVNRDPRKSKSVTT